MRLALDTNRYTDLCRDVAEVVTLVEHAEAVFLAAAGGPTGHSSSAQGIALGAWGPMHRPELSGHPPCA